MPVQCCMCHRVREGSEWVRVREPAAVARSASHTFCPLCEQKFRQRWGLVGQKAA
jgi:hypothetical protein